MNLMECPACSFTCEVVGGVDVLTRHLVELHRIDFGIAEDTASEEFDRVFLEKPDSRPMWEETTS